MKKLVYVLAASFGILTLGSCVKSRTCTCTYEYSDGTTSTSSGTVTGTKSASEASCNNGDYSSSSYTVDCELQ